MTAPAQPIGLYVHLPFCRVKCTYCAFAVSTDRRLEDAYADALTSELQLRRVIGATVTSIFMGGGTPSLFPLERLTDLLSEIRSLYVTDADAEVTLEANPEDVTEESIGRWKALGINRLSVGIQSLDDRELYPLGRGHGRAQALDALEAATSSALRVSADLILGLPGQTEASFRESLRRILEAGVGHVSLYILDLEPESTLHRHVIGGRTQLPDDELTATLYHAAVEMTSGAGLLQYEVSNFARPGEESRHNLRYWDRLPYLGLGLGAHSFDGNVRTANSRVMDEYLAAIGQGREAIVFRETLSDENERHEKLFLSLRQKRGLRYADLVGMCGMEGERWIDRGVEEGWLNRSGERVSFTSDGFLLSNELISQLF